MDTSNKTFKVAVIGAGSVGFTRGIIKDLLSVPEFKNIELAFTDINQHNLDMAQQLIQRDIDANGLNIKIACTLDRREAFKNAKYVFNFVRIGMLEAFRHDVEIPMKYGVDQCVGDTLCAGGIMYGQRGIAQMLAFCKDIREVAAPDCLMLNYANPNAMMTWAANEFGGVKTLGLCHGVQNGHKLIGEAFSIPWQELDITCVGINHQTWYTSIKHHGVELKDKLLEAMENNPQIAEQEKVRIDMLRRFGYFSTESNGHLSEYVPWYRKNVANIGNWICMDRWINGESGGYLRHCIERRNWYETDFPNWLKQPPFEYDHARMSIEHGAHIVEALETGRVYRGHFNVVNGGVISNLPADAVIEAPGYVDGNGISIPEYGPLPMGCAAVCNSSIQVQRLAVHAAVNGDDTLLRQAMLMDPLTGAVLEPHEIWQMTDEMLVAEEEWLPQYADAIAAAKERLAQNKIAVNKPQSTTRKRLKSVEEIAQDAESQKMYTKSAHQN